MSLYEYMMKVGEDAIDSGLLAREVRYELYRIATRFHHGHRQEGTSDLCRRRDQGFFPCQRWQLHRVQERIIEQVG
jgi:hypothetical protein